jgi:proteasome lid subunit RPN8/RPN11
MEEVYLTDKAFIGMIVSSVEVFKSECLGLLLGYKETDRITVEYTIPYLSAKRTPSDVEPNFKREAECVLLLPRLSHLEHVGFFHSHTQWGRSRARPEPSVEDLESMIEGQVEIILAINKSKKQKAWRNTAKGYLSGSIGDYDFDLASYYFHPQKKVWQQVPIKCPYAVGIEQAFEY